ncbi:MAG: hypothetical protein AAF098_16840 [Pseudomonadota bacterium]
MQVFRQVRQAVLGLALTILGGLSIAAQSAEVGVAYHATGPGGLISDGFLTRYHQGGTRALVQSQLSSMQSAGVDAIRTAIWIGAETVPVDNRSTNRRYMIAFPPRPQDLTNIKNYVDDVNAAGLTLDLALKWGTGRADFNVGCVNTSDQPGYCSTTGLGPDHMSLSTFENNMKPLTIAKIIQQISPGEVRYFYYDAEVIYDPDLGSLSGSAKRTRRNNNWHFEKGYGYFASILTSQNKGTPSVYYIITRNPNPNQTIRTWSWNILPPGPYPALYGHRTMYHPVRTATFIENTFAAKGWPSSWKPPRFDVSFYLDTPNQGLYDDFVQKLISDYDAVMKTAFGFPNELGIAETTYFGNSSRRSNACTASALNNSRVESFFFWSTPYSQEREGGNGSPGYYATRQGPITNISGC